MRASSRPSGPSNAGSGTWVAASGRRPARRTRPTARRRRRRHRHQLASSASLEQLARTPGRAGSSWSRIRSTVRGAQPAARPRASADASAWSRSRSSATRQPGQRAGPTRQTHGPNGSPSDHATRGPTPGVALGAVVEQPGGEHVRSRHAAAPQRTPRRRGRGAGRRRASRRTGRAPRAEPGRQRPLAPRGPTRAVRCARTWRALRPRPPATIGRSTDRSGSPEIGAAAEDAGRTPIRRMKIPYCVEERPAAATRVRGGRNRNRTVEPSSGGTGIRLKIAEHDVDHDEVVRGPSTSSRAAGRRRRRRSTHAGTTNAPSDGQEQVRDRARERDHHLAVAPVAQVRRVDRRRLRPADQEPAETASTRRSAGPPIGSKWTIGLSVSRPNSLAVASPSR